jgi:hypothetical protein
MQSWFTNVDDKRRRHPVSVPGLEMTSATNEDLVVALPPLTTHSANPCSHPSRLLAFTTLIMRFAAVLALTFACAEAFDVIQLTPDNYDEMTDGKTVFLKFFAPWVSRLTG